MLRPIRYIDRRPLGYRLIIAIGLIGGILVYLHGREATETHHIIVNILVSVIALTVAFWLVDPRPHERTILVGRDLKVVVSVVLSVTLAAGALSVVEIVKTNQRSNAILKIAIVLSVVVVAGVVLLRLSGITYLIRNDRRRGSFLRVGRIWTIAGFLMIVWLLLIKMAKDKLGNTILFDQVSISHLLLLVIFLFTLLATCLTFASLSYEEFGSAKILLTTLLLTITIASLSAGSVGYLRYSNEDDTSALLSLFAGMIAIATIGIGVWGAWIHGKIESLAKLEGRLRNLDQLTVVAAESAFMSLPDFSESQQIPDHTVKTLRTLNSLVFEDAEASILQYLDSANNGSRLWYARALYLFGSGNFYEARKTLQNHVSCADMDLAMETNFLYRLGICERQLLQWAVAIKTFITLYSIGTNDAKNKATLGLVVTLVAWQPGNQDPDWTRTQQQLASVFGTIIDGNPQKTAFKLASELFLAEGDNAMAAAYMMKSWLWMEDDDRENPEFVRRALERARNVAQTKREFREDNMRLTYDMFIAWCNGMSFFLALTDPDRNVRACANNNAAQDLVSCLLTLDRLELKAESYRLRSSNEPYSCLLYSEVSECEIEPETFSRDARYLRDAFEAIAEVWE